MNYESCLAYDGGDCCDPRSANDRIRQGDQIGLFYSLMANFEGKFKKLMVRIAVAPY